MKLLFLISFIVIIFFTLWFFGLPPFECPEYVNQTPGIRVQGYWEGPLSVHNCPSTKIVF